MAAAGVAYAADNVMVAEVESLLAPLEADAAESPAIMRAVAESKGALARASALKGEAATKHREILQATALVWARIGRDSSRALGAEVASERLEAELTELETELSRAHAAVEQAKARVGRAREELKSLREGGEVNAATGAGGAAATGGG